MRISVVIGLNFGDEGKGNVTQALIDKNSAIVRFNGANQVGHTIIHNGIIHISSSFGAGVLKGTPVFYSKHTALNYRNAIVEEIVLGEKGIKNPKIIIDENAIVITPIDQELDNKKNGMTTGVGYNVALQREKNHVHFRYRDLLYPLIVKQKLKDIYYYHYHKNITIEKLSELEEDIKYFMPIVQIMSTKEWYKRLNKFDHIIFEGGQGIMLDKKCGFYPYVTNSNTTMKNASKIIKKLKGRLISIFYVTRSYNTRHGKGFILDFKPVNVPKDTTNVFNSHQGEIRCTALPLEQLEYAVNCNNPYVPEFSIKVLVVTHIDEYNIPYSNTTLKHKLNVSDVVLVRIPELKSI